MPADRTSQPPGLKPRRDLPYPSKVVQLACEKYFPHWSTRVPSGAIEFAPNVTPGTFNDPPPPMADDDLPPSESLLFPTETLDAEPYTSSSSKKPHGRAKPENYVPRPPNAFILFRSAFIRNRNVSTNVETNHSTLSKIIGLTWQNLPDQEKRVWHRKAKLAEAEHRIKFPAYAFKPVHSKGRKSVYKAAGSSRKVREVGPRDHVRCEKIAEFLVQGLKGDELDAAIKEFDKGHVPEFVTRFEAPITEKSFLDFTRRNSPEERRSESAPIPDSALPLMKKRLAKQPRSASAATLTRSKPFQNSLTSAGDGSLRVHTGLPPPFEMEEAEHHQRRLLSLGHFSFDQSRPGSSSSFSSYNLALNTSDVHSLSSPYDPNTPTHSFAHSFSPAPSIPSPHSHTLSLPELHVDSSYVTESRPSSVDHGHGNLWPSPCHSHQSLPSSNGMSSMPPTPLSFSTGNLQLPEDAAYGNSVGVYQQHQYQQHQQHLDIMAQTHHHHDHADPPPEYTMHPTIHPSKSLQMTMPAHIMAPLDYTTSSMGGYRAQEVDIPELGYHDDGHCAGQYTEADCTYSSSYDIVGQQHQQDMDYQQQEQDGGEATILSPSPVTPTGRAIAQMENYGFMMRPLPSYSTRAS